MISDESKSRRAMNVVAQEETHRRLEREIRELIHALTSKLSNLHLLSKADPDLNHNGRNHGGHGGNGGGESPKVVSLSGLNTGAAMRADWGEAVDTHVGFGVEGRFAGAYANGNYQAVNNSLVLGGRCTAKDPGIHLDLIPHQIRELGTNYEEKRKRKLHKEKKSGKSKASSSSSSSSSMSSDSES